MGMNEKMKLIKMLVCKYFINFEICVLLLNVLGC